jgi:hypothetical protein
MLCLFIPLICPVNPTEELKLVLHDVPMRTGMLELKTEDK